MFGRYRSSKRYAWSKNLQGQDHEQAIRDLRIAGGYTVMPSGDLPEEDVPRNVRMIREDGTVIPIDCRFGGRNPVTGGDLWIATAPAWVGADRTPAVEVDYLPPRASLALRIQGQCE